MTASLNHVALRVPRAALDEPSRSQILALCRDIFGWTEGDNTGERDDPLIMYTGAFGEFVYLARHDRDASDASDLDHFGMQMTNGAEFERVAGAARAVADSGRPVVVSATDARTTHGAATSYTLTSTYIQIAGLFTVELQHLTKQN